MAKRKPKALQDTDELIDSSIREAAAAHPRAKPKGTAGRKTTVSYDRPGKLHISVTQDTFDTLDEALLKEKKKRRPDKVDKGLIIEEALTAWFKKNKIT